MRGYESVRHVTSNFLWKNKNTEMLAQTYEQLILCNEVQIDFNELKGS